MDSKKVPLVSILIMTYNHEEFIAQTIESCLKQTFQDFEICIGDDCSTDNTVQIVNDYSKKYPNKIKLVQQEQNMGKISLAINYNAIIDICMGKYLAILDGDDFMVNNRLEKQFHFLENNLDYFAVSNEEFAIDSAGNELNHKSNRIIKDGTLTSKDIILNGNVFSNCYMARNDKKILQADRSLKIMGDWYIIIKMSTVGKLGFLDERLTKKIVHTSNVTITKKRNMEEDTLLTLALVEYNYPELTTYVNMRRILILIYEIKMGKFKLIKYLLNYSLFLIVRAFYLKAVYLIKRKFL